MTLDARLRLFLFLAGTFMVSLVVGDIIGGKLTHLDIGGTTFAISVGMIPFPVTFLLTDLLNEFYGRRAARLVTLVGFVMAFFSFAVIALAVQLPWAPETQKAGWGGVNEGAFDRVFWGSQRILLASLMAYLIAQFLDIGVFHALKKRTQNRYLWLRATGSTVVSQLVDTLFINVLAWAGQREPVEIAKTAGISYLVKLVVAIGLTPLIYAGHAILERSMGLAPVKLGPDGEALPDDNDATKKFERVA